MDREQSRLKIEEDRNTMENKEENGTLKLKMEKISLILDRDLMKK